MSFTSFRPSSNRPRRTYYLPVPEIPSCRCAGNGVKNRRGSVDEVKVHLPTTPNPLSDDDFTSPSMFHVISTNRDTVQGNKRRSTYTRLGLWCVNSRRDSPPLTIIVRLLSFGSFLDRTLSSSLQSPVSYDPNRPTGRTGPSLRGGPTVDPLPPQVTDSPLSVSAPGLTGLCGDVNVGDNGFPSLISVGSSLYTDSDFHNTIISLCFLKGNTSAWYLVTQGPTKRKLLLCSVVTMVLVLLPSLGMLSGP